MMNRAFSLLELLLALALGALVLFGALPLLSKLTARNQVVTQAQELANLLQVARNAALVFGEPVQICGSRSPNLCDGGWEARLIAVGEQTGRLVHSVAPVGPGVRLRWQSSLGLNTSLSFQADGTLRNYQRGSFLYYLKDDVQAVVAVVVTPLGRTRINYPSGAAREPGPGR